MLTPLVLDLRRSARPGVDAMEAGPPDGFAEDLTLPPELELLSCCPEEDMEALRIPFGCAAFMTDARAGKFRPKLG